MSDFDKTPGQDKMDIEALLRRSLETRAQDVRPDPATWQKVSQRIRRGQLMRWSLAGAGAMGALVIAAIVLPGLLDRNNVDLGGEFSAKPAPEETEVARGGGGEAPCGGPQHVSAVLARDGEGLEGTIWALCDDGSETVLDSQRPPGAYDHHPALSWDGQSLVFERVDDQGLSTLVHVDMNTGAEQTLMGGAAPAFASDGRLAWVQRLDEAQDRILVGQLFSEPDLEFPVVEGEDGETYDVARLAFDPSGQTLYAEAGYEGNVLYRYDVGSMYRSSSRGSLASQRVQEPEPTERYAGPGPGHQPGAVSVITRCCSGAEGDPFSQAELRVLSDGEVNRTVELPSEFKVDDAVYWTTWAPIGPLRTTDDGVTIWSGGSRAGYLVGDGDGMWMVEPDGTARLITENVSSAAANPALTSEPAAGSSGANEPPREGDASDGADLPAPVAETRERILAAVDARSFEQLRDVMAEQFTYSHGDDGGRDGAISRLREMEQRGEDPFGLIERLLRAPHGHMPNESAPAYWFWPRPFVTPADDWTEDDLAILRQLGASQEDIDGWYQYGDYIGYRIGIDEDGNWTSFVAGD